MARKSPFKNPAPPRIEGDGSGSATQEELDSIAAEKMEKFLGFQSDERAENSTLDVHSGDLNGAPTVDQPASAGGTLRLAGYEILGELGRGGMGVVFKARQIRLNRLVALKMVLAGAQARPEDLVRFLAEAEAVARLQHPHIVQIYETNQHNGLPYFVLEYVEGGSLSKKLRVAPLPPREAASLVETVARAIQVAHERGIIHRDLKPGNILLTPEGQPKITDFGISKRVEVTDGLTVTGEILGTPSYMAPEQAHGDTGRVGPQVDVYGLGAVLYELLTGRPPFRAASHVATLRQVMEDDPVSPRRLQPTVLRDLETICMKALAKEPARRYASANDLADDLRRCLRNEPIQARPAGSLERLWRWSKRKPGLAASIALTLATFVTAFVIVLLALDRTRKHARSEAEQRRAAELRLAENEFDRGLALSQQGDPSLGLLWMARSLERLPQNFPSLDFVIRANLAAWQADACTLQGIIETRDLATQRTRNPARAREGSNKSEGLAFSPTAAVALTGGIDGNVRAWDLATQTPLWIAQFSLPVFAIAYSPDGQVAVATTLDEAQFLDPSTGAQIGKPLWHNGPVWSVAFSPDGKTIVTGSWDKDANTGVAQLWDVATRQRVGRMVPHDRPVRAVTFSPDGRKFATACDDGFVEQWNASTQESMGVPSLRHGGPVNAIAYHPNSRFILTGADDHAAHLWNADTGAPVGLPLRHDEQVHAAAFSPDGKRIVTASADKTARLWDSSSLGQASAAVVQTGTSLHHQALIVAVAFNPSDGNTVLTRSSDGNVKQWRLSARRQSARTFLPEAMPIAATFSADATRILIGCLNETAALWNSNTGEQIGASIRHQAAVMALAFSPDGTLALSGDKKGVLRLTNAQTGVLIIEFTVPNELRAAAFTSNSNKVLVVCSNGDAYEYDVSSRKLSDLSVKPAGTVASVALSELGRFMLLGRADGTVERWDLTTCQRVELSPPTAVAVDMVTISADGNTAGALYRNGEAHFWHSATGKAVIVPLENHTHAKTLQLSADGTVAATLSGDGAVRLWDTVTGEAIATPGQRQGRAHAVAFSPDSQLISTGNRDDSARLWSARTGKPVATAFRHGGQVKMVAFSPDGRYLLSGDVTGAARLWEIPPPSEGSPETVRDRLAVLLGVELDAAGVPKVLSADEWNHRR